MDRCGPLVDALDALAGCLRSEALAAGSMADALVLAEALGRLHWDNISGHFSDEPFEAALADRWGPDLTRRARPRSRRPGWLHVATRLYRAGGHSRLVTQLADGLAARGIANRLILTRRGGSRQRRQAAAHFAGLSTPFGLGAPARAAALLAEMRGAETVLLHHHPDDIAVALAARLAQAEGHRVLFVNHADHVFSFGPGAADCVLEICGTGWKTTRDRRHARAQAFMGIPMIADGHVVPAHAGHRDGPILSVGGGPKFAPGQGLSFPDFLLALLPRVPNDVVLVGPEGTDAYWQPLRAAYPDRVRFLGPRPAAELAQHFARASAYVDSFPLDGGTVFSQALMAGLPVFGPNAARSPGVSPADALRFDTTAAMAEALVAYLDGGPPDPAQDEARDRIRHHHASGAVADRVIAAAAGRIDPPPDYVMTLGRRSSDYNAERWLDEGRLHLPKRIWRRLSPVGRLRLHRRIGTLDALPEADRRTLRRRLWIG